MTLETIPRKENDEKVNMDDINQQMWNCMAAEDIIEFMASPEAKADPKNLKEAKRQLALRGLAPLGHGGATVADSPKKLELEEERKVQDHTFPARIAMMPEEPAITAILRLKYGSKTASQIDVAQLLKEILVQEGRIRNGDFRMLEEHLLSHVIALNAVVDRMLNNMSQSTTMNQTQIYGQLMLKAQAQCRVTIATLVDIKNPNRTTFIKQQNNAVNQQINNQQVQESSTKSEKIANEQLSNEVKHEKLDIRGTTETNAINPSVETLAELKGSSDARGQSNKQDERP